MLLKIASLNLVMVMKMMKYLTKTSKTLILMQKKEKMKMRSSTLRILLEDMRQRETAVVAVIKLSQPVTPNQALMKHQFQRKEARRNLPHQKQCKNRPYKRNQAMSKRLLQASQTMTLMNQSKT